MAANPFAGGKITALTERVRANTKAQIIRLTNEKTAANQRAIASLFGSPAPIRRYVDGTLGKSLDQVKPDGFTLTEFSTLEFVVDAALRTVITGSPYGPELQGHYQDDHWLYVNDARRSAATEGAVVSIKETDTVVILNARPYARAIEGGTPGFYKGEYVARRPGLSAQAPNGVYEIAARILRRRFSRLARIAFAFRQPGGPATTEAGIGRGPFPALEISSALV